MLDEMDLPYEEAPGEAAFYGPKADFIVRDCIGRQWQLGTVQLDYVLPERFGLEYTGADNQPHRPVMIHRAPFGSMERFMGILIEHFAGAFPLWLAPEQVRVLPISDKVADYAQRVLADAPGRRPPRERRPPAREDRRQDPRRAAREDPGHARRRRKEAETGTVSYRDRIDGDQGAMPLAQAIDRLAAERASRQSRQAALPSGPAVAVMIPPKITLTESNIMEPIVVKPARAGPSAQSAAIRASGRSRELSQAGHLR